MNGRHLYIATIELMCEKLGNYVNLEDCWGLKTTHGGEMCVCVFVCVLLRLLLPATRMSAHSIETCPRFSFIYLCASPCPFFSGTMQFLFFSSLYLASVRFFFHLHGFLHVVVVVVRGPCVCSETHFRMISEYVLCAVILMCVCWFSLLLRLSFAWLPRHKGKLKLFRLCSNRKEL